MVQKIKTRKPADLEKKRLISISNAAVIANQIRATTGAVDK
jgi:hypothetical protein